MALEIISLSEFENKGITETKKDISEPDENEIGNIESVLNGIASGVLKIPEGVVSLGAELYDLGADTNTSAKVEKFFDDINIFEEKAEATAAGKITETLIGIGIPGGVAFTKGASLANKAIKAKKAKKYFNLDKKSLDSNQLRTARKEAVSLTKKDKLKSYAVGTLGSGVAEGVFVADVESIGTFGDLVGGPTELDRSNDEDVTRDLVNRVKFGTEGALFSGLIGGVGATIKAIANRSKKLEASDDAIDKILEKVGGSLRARGFKPPTFFKLERETIGKRSADVNRAQNVARETNKIIDGLFPTFKSIYDKTTQENRKKLSKVVNDALLSGSPKIGDDAKVVFGTMSKEKVDTAIEQLKKYGASQKDIDKLFKGFENIRSSWGDMFSSIGYALKGENDKAFKEFTKEFGDKFQEYLGGTYEVFVNKPLLPWLKYKPTEEVVNKAVDMFMASGTATREQAQTYVSEIIKTARLPRALTFSHSRNPDPIFKAPPGFLKDSISKEVLDAALSPDKFISLKFLPKDKREIVEQLLGKVEDPTQTILAGTERISGITRVNEFYRRLKDFSDEAIKKGRPGMFFDNTDEGYRAAEKVFGAGNVETAFFDPNRVFEIGSGNPLAGKLTSKAIQQALEVGEKNLISNPSLSFVYDNFILFPKATSQIAKTILSPITHVRNFVSAGAFAAANGIIPGLTSPVEIAKAMKDSYKALQIPVVGARKSNEFYEELLRLGVVNSNVRLGDLRRLLKDIDFGEGLNNRSGLKLLTNQLKKVKKFSEDLYTAEDDFWKITTFAIEKSRLAKAYSKAGIKRTDKQLMEEAADIVRNNVPNYDYVGEFIKTLRKFPVGNFVSFPAEILRTGTNIVRRALKEINYKETLEDGTVVKPLQGIGFKRLFGFGTTVAAVPYMTVEAAKTMYNVTEDEMQALRRYVPEWSKNSTLIPLRDKKGKLKYVDFSHGNAYDTLIRPVQTVINAVAEGRDDENGIMDDFLKGLFVSTKELGEPFISESIWTEAASDIIFRGGRTRDFKEIYNPNALAGEKAKKIIEHLVESQTPGSWNAFKRLDLAIKPVDIIQKGKFDEFGQAYELGDELAGLVGFRAINVDPERAINFKIADYRKGIRNSRKLFTSELLKGGPVSPGDIVDRYIIANQAAFKVKKEFFEDYIAALKLKANKKEIDNKVQDRLGKKELKNLQKGLFTPLNISEGVEEAFQENADKIGQENQYKRVKPFLKDVFKIFKNLPIRIQQLPTIRNIFKEVELSPTDTSYLPPSGPPIGPASNMTNVDPQTGLTATELALLPPDDQAIRQKLNRRI
tara:strand:+ start:2491 stop:6405 length:3915 start_codon:yes stop_codon:yes gene_type:complete